MSKPEVYVSIDVEADGPIPGPYSMLSVGAAAFLADGTPYSTFSINLELLPGASGHPDTMAWWEKNPAAWAACRENPEDPRTAMTSFAVWAQGLPGKPVACAYPAGFDWMFVYWYLMRFLGESPFGFSALDMKTYAMAVLRTPFRDTTKKTMPPEWTVVRSIAEHVAVEDAMAQGEMFVRMLQINDHLRPVLVRTP